MEKLKFTIRFFTMLLALPVIMFTELTRKDSVNEKSKQVIEANSQSTSAHSELAYQYTDASGIN